MFVFSLQTGVVHRGKLSCWWNLMKRILTNVERFNGKTNFGVSRRRQRAFSVHENKPIVGGGDVQVVTRTRAENAAWA